MPDIPLPLDFRSDLFTRLVARVTAGESVSLLGVGSCGKSNVVRFLKRADVREFYFGQDAAHTLYTVVDCYKLEDTRDVTVYAALMTAFVEAAPMLGDTGSALVPQLDAWWHEILASDKTALARRRVEQALNTLFQEGRAKRVIILLDDCDALMAQAPLALFRSLRALRDDHKYQLVYLTVTRRELAHLREMSPDYESFFELLAPHMLALKPYQQIDAFIMLKRLAARTSGLRPLSDDEMQNLFRATGGHAGLLRMSFETVKGTDRAADPAVTDYLADKRVVYDEAQKIWDSLEEYEQQDLLLLVQNKNLANGGEAPLLTKGLVIKQNNALRIFAPLFEHFVRAQLPEAAPPPPTDTAQNSRPAHPTILIIDRANRNVRINDRTVPLTDIEIELFTYLHKNCVRACDVNEMINLLMSIAPGGQPFERLRKHLTHLSQTLNAPENKIVVEYPNGTWQVLCGA